MQREEPPMIRLRILKITKPTMVGEKLFRPREGTGVLQQMSRSTL